MYKCLFCGFNNPSEKARFCTECGPTGVSHGWAIDEVDQAPKVDQYKSILGEFYFESNNESEIEMFSLRLRERLKISFDAHSNIISKFTSLKNAIRHLSNFRFEFNENVLEAYAGHDTYLSFRYTNLSDLDLFKVAIYWDDPETTDRVDLQAQTSSFVKPKTSASLGSKVVFDRMGIKEISDLKITVTDQFGESADFKCESFNFKVGNHDQKITQNISTHNQISIEGRGVVDASGMGGEKSSSIGVSNTEPRWRELHFRYVMSASTDKEEGNNIVKPQVTKPFSNELESNINLVSADNGFDQSSLISVLKAAELGNLEGQNTLGEMYLNGDDVAKDDLKALEWFRKAANLGHADALKNLGNMYRDGRAVSQDHEKAVEYFKLAADKGSIKAQNNLGSMYVNGTGVPKSKEQAINWYHKAAEKGSASGQLNLALILDVEEATTDDQEKAAYWLKKSAEQGQINAQYTLGVRYLQGRGVGKNELKAFEWIAKAADQGDAYSQYELGGLYIDGVGVAKDEEQAVYWFRKAAEQGHKAAQVRLGNLYENGVGVPENDLQALNWYKKAADQGYVLGEYNLGTMFYYGSGVDEDNVQAIFWFRKAADQGHAESQHLLGIMYESGLGVLQNKQLAATWYRKAAEQGHAEAIEDLENLDEDESGVPPDGEGFCDYGNYTYQGMIENGIPNGWGTMTWSGDWEGHTYTGEFVNVERHGFGTYTFPDGTIQSGRFENNVFKEAYVEDDEDEDSFDDEDEDSSDDDSPVQDYTYNGPSVNGLAHGVGKMIYSSGDVYKGDFVNGMRHGLGEYTFANGAQQMGHFVDNEFCKAASMMESMKIGFKIGAL